MDITKNSLADFFGTNIMPHIDYESELNEEQYEAVKNTEGPELIIASAGSGKTRTLTYRLAYLIEKGVPPERILLLTFTNKAATEMISRATTMLGIRQKIQGGTYHSFCANILRRYGHLIGFQSDFLIKDSVDAVDMLNYIKEQYGFSKEEDFPKGSELAAIFSVSINKEKTIEWVLQNKYPKYVDYLTEIEQMQSLYTQYKMERNILDYDDLLIYANRLLREHENIRRTLSDTYEYIMVDEYQDSNRLQFELISLLRSFENKNICVVGDDLQCIIEGTMIRTKKGLLPIEIINKRDKLMVSSGHGNIRYVKPKEIIKKHYVGDVYEIKTKSGKVLTVTGEHTMFSYVKKSKPRRIDTADFYLFGADGDDEYDYLHKLWISDKRLIREIQDKELYDIEETMDEFNRLLQEKRFSYLHMEQYANVLSECTHCFRQAKDLEVGMFVPVYNDNLQKLINDQITDITVKPYSGYIYDINVNFYMNFYANDICVHNCIYGFRGSNHKNILRFPKQFAPCKMIILNRNYRSNQEILDFTNAVSMEAKERFDKTLVGTHSSGHLPEIIYMDNDRTEAQAVLYDIVKRHTELGIPYSEMAVLIRSSNDSNLLELLIQQESRKYNIPYKKFGGLKFMERAFVKDIFAFLKVLVNERDEISWFRIFQMYINIGPVYAKRIVDEINTIGVEAALTNPKHQGKKYGECLPYIWNFYKELKTKDFHQQIDDIINIHYFGARKLSIDNMKSKTSIINDKRVELDENIEEAQILIDMASAYKTASDFLNDITLDANINGDNEDDFLTISTVHSAKGLEFNTVYILNCVDGCFPWIKLPAANTDEAKQEAEEEMEEERRVFYVAITRAKENLKLYIPNYIYKYGTPNKTIISRFIKYSKSFCKEIIIS